ncbi:exocyst complex component EXO70B1-like [Wolffia australiana]
MERLEAARRTLQSALATCAAAAAALDLSGRRLAEISARLPPAAPPLVAQLRAAVAPAAAVLAVFDAVHGLEPHLLSDPRHDTAAYLLLLRRLDRALDFLSRACPPAIEPAAALLQRPDRAALDPADPLDGGLLLPVLRRLASFPAPTPPELGLVLRRLSATARADLAVRTFAEERALSAAARLAAAPRWLDRVALAVSDVLPAERRLCSAAFPAAASLCFAEIVSQSGFLLFLVSPSILPVRDGPDKLLQLLDMFATLDGLRAGFNELFAGPSLDQARTATRGLVRRLVDGACGLFWEIPAQVEMQRSAAPPPGAGAPRQVRAVVGLCNELLGPARRPALDQVVGISRCWRGEEPEPGLVAAAMANVVAALEENLRVWAGSYADPAQKSLFLMNAHWELQKSARGAPLGALLGAGWLDGRRRRSERFRETYVRESWAALRRRTGEFKKGFEEMWRVHVRWAVEDKALRGEVQMAIAKTVLPACGEEEEREALERMIFSLFLGGGEKGLNGFGSKSGRGRMRKLADGGKLHLSAAPVA